MALITIKRRTTKTSGTIKLRFRLRDGRDLELYHKSDIEAELSALSKFDDYGKKKPRVTGYDPDLESSIKLEMERMAKAYETMQEKGMDMTSEIFEQEIAKVTFEVKQIRSEQESLIARFKRYTEEALRDRIIGKARYDHFVTFGNKLNRYLIIKGLSEISPAEVDPEFLMDFRNFIFDDLIYLVSLQVADEVFWAASIGIQRILFQKFLHFVLPAGIHAGGDGLPDGVRAVHLRGRNKQNSAVGALQRRRDVSAYVLNIFRNRTHSMTFPS